MQGINVSKNNELPIRFSHYSLKYESLISTEKYFPLFVHLFNGWYSGVPVNRCLKSRVYLLCTWCRTKAVLSMTYIDLTEHSPCDWIPPEGRNQENWGHKHKEGWQTGRQNGLCQYGTLVTDTMDNIVVLWPMTFSGEALSLKSTPVAKSSVFIPRKEPS